jgi:hypothetical protein
LTRPARQLLLGLIAVYAVGITRDLWESDGAWIVVQSMVTAAITLFAVLFYIAAFMALAFPAIPEQFGGGQPRLVRLLVASEDAEGIRALGIPIEGKQRISNPVVLLYETSDSYLLEVEASGPLENTIVTVPRGYVSDRWITRSVEVKKNIVQALVLGY